MLSRQQASCFVKFSGQFWFRVKVVMILWHALAQNIKIFCLQPNLRISECLRLLTLWYGLGGEIVLINTLGLYKYFCSILNLLSISPAFYKQLFCPFPFAKKLETQTVSTLSLLKQKTFVRWRNCIIQFHQQNYDQFY